MGCGVSGPVPGVAARGGLAGHWESRQGSAGAWRGSAAAAEPGRRVRGHLRVAGTAVAMPARPGAADDPVEALLTALDRWSQAGAGDASPAAYLEVGDEQLRGGYPLTAGQAAELAALLRGTCSGGAAPRPGEAASSAPAGRGRAGMAEGRSR